MERSQECLRRSRASESDVLRAGRRGPAHADRADATVYRRSRGTYGLTISNIFHAGDGNLHPIILFNPRKPGDLEKAQRGGRGHSGILHPLSAGRLRANTASGWKRMN